MCTRSYLMNGRKRSKGAIGETTKAVDKSLQKALNLKNVVFMDVTPRGSCKHTKELENPPSSSRAQRKL
jgi:hypothetical protein